MTADNSFWQLFRHKHQDIHPRWLRIPNSRWSGYICSVELGHRVYNPMSVSEILIIQRTINQLVRWFFKIRCIYLLTLYSKVTQNWHVKRIMSLHTMISQNILGISLINIQCNLKVIDLHAKKYPDLKEWQPAYTSPGTIIWCFQETSLMVLGSII